MIAADFSEYCVGTVFLVYDFLFDIVRKTEIVADFKRCAFCRKVITVFLFSYIGGIRFFEFL